MKMNSKRETADALLPFSTQGDVVVNRGGGLCGCFSDMSTCLWGYCCPCYLFGRTLTRAGVTARAWSGCAMYLLMVLVTAALALLVVLGFLGRLDKYSDCVADQRVVPDPTDGSSSDSAAPLAEADDPCSSLLGTALSWYFARVWLINMEALVVAGLLCGYYRERIKIALGGAAGTMSCSSFLVHCLPCTHFCALCQEARAVGDPTMANYDGQRGLSI
jgi:Cys-rich protein (TIGR01571 family)